MALTASTQTISELLENFHRANTVEKKYATLLQFRSQFSEANLCENVTEEDFSRLYKSLINVNDAKLQQEACCTLSTIFLDKKHEKPSFFHSVQQIASRNSKLKVFVIFEALNDNAVAAVSNDPQIINFFMDCLQSINVEKMDWLSPTACTDNLQKLIDNEKKALTEDEELEEKIVLQSLNLLSRLYKMLDFISTKQIQLYDSIIMDRILTLVYMGFKRQREPALKLFKEAIDSGTGFRVRQISPNAWILYKKSLQDFYCPRMCLLVTGGYYDWADQWNCSIQLLGKDLHRGAGLINNLLSVEEKAFKSSDTNIRKQAFNSWKLLVDNFALDPQELASARRIKLLCVPLIAKNSKTEVIAFAKFQVWWHLIVKVYNDLPKFVNSVLVPFLNFCFGPLGDTPLLSSKLDICASPGKRFPKTKLASLDALLQLLAVTKADCGVFSPILEERLPLAITTQTFEESYKPFTHCVFEAFLILGQFKEVEIPNRHLVGEVLWRNLISKIEDTKAELKTIMYKELILVTIEMTHYISDNTLIKNLLFDVILVSLAEKAKNFVFTDDTLANLINVLLDELSLKEHNKTYCDAMKNLLQEILKPNYMNTILVNKLQLLNSVLGKLQKATENNNQNMLVEMWCMLAEVSTKYMESCQQINEGDAAKHNFSTIQAILAYPFSYLFLEDLTQVQKVIQCWWEMYKQFDTQADLETTVQPNEVLIDTANMLRDCLKKEKRCCPLFAGCLYSLITNISYEPLLAQEEVPSIVHLINDLISYTFKESQFNSLEIVLRSLSALLITVYGLDIKKSMQYLETVRPSIEFILSRDTDENVGKEIAGVWETVATIFKGLQKYLTYDLLSTFQKSIVLALSHTNEEIVSQTQVILSMANDLDEKASKFLLDIARFKKKSSNIGQKSGNKPKQVKIVGSFLNRKSSANLTPHIFATPATNKNKQKAPQKTIVPSDSDSQEYVVIKSDIKFDVNRLTEHQKESLKKRRDDIPALYNDLSQSGSQDSQELQKWFEKKQISSKKSSSNCDSNKENKVTPSESTSAVQTTSKPEEGLRKESTQIQEADSKTEIKSNKDASGKDSEPEPTVAKKLDFESREEYPENKEAQNRTSPSMLEGAKRRSRKSNLEKQSDEQEENQVSKTISQSVNRPKKKVKSLDSKDTPETSKKASKRKADDDEMENQKRRKVNSSESSDNDSTKSSENEELLNKRVKSEISRLQIDMVRSVFEPLPNRRRSKLTDCSCKDPNCKKNHSPGRLRSEGKPESSKKQSRPHQDSVKKRPRKSSKQESEDEERKSRKTKLEIVKVSETSEEKKQEDSELNAAIEPTVAENTQDLEEIVESSQDSAAERKITNRFSDKKLLIKIDKMNARVINEPQNTEVESTVPEKLECKEEAKEALVPADQEDNATEVFDNQSVSETVDTKKHDSSPSLKNLHLSSPKGIVKRTSKIKPFTLQGRAAQMLGLVTKQGLMEKDAKAEEETIKVILQKPRSQESDTYTKKGSSKESEKMGNQSGSRQEKIFNNMKSADYCSSPPTKLFGGLKNDGEKISPNVAKNSSDFGLSETSVSSEKESVGETSPTRDKELPILEWSSANPPSLTASPSAGILKRYNQSLPEIPGDPEVVTPNKRKRVSFADPPVSQKMGYEVATGDSPHKMSKSNRTYSMRRDTPLKPKQNRLRMFQMDVEKADKNEIQLENLNGVEIEVEKSEELVEMTDDLAFSEDALMKIHGEVTCPESSTPVRITVENFTEIKISETSIQNNEVKAVEETKSKSSNLVEEIFGTQEDMFGVVDTSDESLKILNQKYKANTLDPIVTLDSLKFNTTKDSLSDTASTVTDCGKNETLEDTVDVQNVSSFDSVDEGFCGKLIRCSTSTAEGEQDTLPVTDSVFGSISQETQSSTQSVVNLPKPETLDSTQPIFPSLMESKEPVNSIVENLANPLWVSHLASALATREIHTIGDLAKLSEREINRIPVKGNPKVAFVKSILARFESTKTGVPASNSDLVHLEKTPLEGTTAPAQTSSGYPENESSVPVPALSSNLDLITSKLLLTNEAAEGTHASAIQSQKIPSHTLTRSVAVQMDLKDLLDEIDVNLVLQSAARRCTPESLLAQYKAKMRNMPKPELETETMRMLGLDSKQSYNEVTLRSACKACGINKVLLKLPDIFSGDKQFFVKVLSAYKQKLNVSDCLSALDVNKVKDALCQKCKSSELVEMLSKSLKEEEEKGVGEPMMDLSDFSRILKRVPTDLLISHTVANDELIPSHIVLDIALQNSTDDAIAKTLSTQSNVKKESIFHKLWTTSSALSHVEKEASEAEMLEIIKAISLRLRPEKLLEAFRDSMKDDNDATEKELLGLFKLISAKLKPAKLLDVFYECMKDKIA